MTKPIWKKVTEIEPGIYHYGGYAEKPSRSFAPVIAKERITYNMPNWHAFIADYVEPEMPLPDLEVDAKVQVRDFDAQIWQNGHFAKFENGKCYTWYSGSTSWSVGASGTTSWNQWRLPEGEK